MDTKVHTIKDFKINLEISFCRIYVHISVQIVILFYMFTNLFCHIFYVLIPIDLHVIV